MIKSKTNSPQMPQILLKCKKGETLIESLASTLIFVILMVAVTAIIATSIRMTGYYTANSNTRQTNANMGILEKAPPVSGEHIFTISGNGIDDIEIKVNLSQEGNLKIFYPEVSP